MKCKISPRSISQARSHGERCRHGECTGSSLSTLRHLAGPVPCTLPVTDEEATAATAGAAVVPLTRSRGSASKLSIVKSGCNVTTMAKQSQIAPTKGGLNRLTRTLTLVVAPRRLYLHRDALQRKWAKGGAAGPARPCILKGLAMAARHDGMHGRQGHLCVCIDCGLGAWGTARICMNQETKQGNKQQATNVSRVAGVLGRVSFAQSGGSRAAHRPLTNGFQSYTDDHQLCAAPWFGGETYS